MSSDPVSSPPPAAPAAKAPPPPLTARAPRPSAVRVRRSAVMLAVLGASGLLAGAFAWAFIVSPELRAEARERKLDGRTEEARGAVRPSEAVTDGPATYGHLDQLPPPRRLNGEPEGSADPSASAPAPARVSSPRYDAYPPSSPVTRGPNPGEEARRSGLFFGGDGGRPAAQGEGGTDGASSALGRDYAAVYNGHQLLQPLSPYELKAGAVISAALLNGVDTTRPGPVVATVTQHVFDTVSGRHLVIPQGSRLIGRHEGESRYGDRRAFLVWQRLILPNGKSLILTDESGVDAQGTVGVQGRVDRRLGALAVATLFAGAITTLGTIARSDDDNDGFWGDVGDAAAIEGAQVGGRLIGRELEVRPSIRVRPGAPVRVLLTRDLILEPYRP